ncbi:hypothetical protein D1007_16584 [Hordeum vulgare]|nr:hypothetical protein D1007_16584 [Hordeum vulgare]
MEVDTANTATSQLAAPAAREVILLDDDDQRPPVAAAEPFVSEVPVAEMYVKACEVGSAYATLAPEKTQLTANLKTTTNEVAALKKTLEEKDKVLVEAQAISKSLEVEVEKMQKNRMKWMNQLKDMNRRANAQEKYVGDFATKMLELLTEFYEDLGKESEEVEPSLDPMNTPLGDGPALNLFWKAP